MTVIPLNILEVAPAIIFPLCYYKHCEGGRPHRLIAGLYTLDDINSAIELAREGLCPTLN